MKKVYTDPELGYSQDDEFEEPVGFNFNLDCDKQQKSTIEGTTPEEDNFF